MTISIALFRGINVGGKNILPMKTLTSALTGVGLDRVRTYIQSGNVVFRSGKSDPHLLSREIKTAIAKSHGLEPEVLVLSVDELRSAMNGCPFAGGETDPKTLHLLFLASVPTEPDLERLEELKISSERFQLADRVFYLLAPEGIARSKLAANVERAMGVPTTARNWRTATRLLSMAEELIDA